MSKMIRNFDDFKNNGKKNENLKKFSGKSKAAQNEEVDDVSDIDDFKQFPDPTGNNGKQSHRAEVANKQSNIRSTQTPVGDETQNLNHMDVTKVQAGDHSDDSDEENYGPVNFDDTNENVDFFGKVAKFPKNSKASSALKFLDNVKISKKSIWYIMVEQQEDSLQMVKYNSKLGVNLPEFVDTLKKYYLTKLESDKAPQKVVEAFKDITVGGDDKGNFSTIKNIPKVKIDGRSAITVITEDLIKLLSK